MFSTRDAAILSVGALVAGCGGTGIWEVEVWGEEYIEEGIPAEVFADGCSVVFDHFVVGVTGVALRQGGEAAHEGFSAGFVVDLVEAGPQLLGGLESPADHYSELSFTVGPVSGSPTWLGGAEAAAQALGMDVASESVGVSGVLTCGGAGRSFLWVFDTSTTYVCEPSDLTLARGGVDRSQLTIHGDHLFYDALEDDDAQVRGSALFNADGDGDGQISQSELAAVSVVPLGYEVGSHTEVGDLGAFVRELTRSLGHIDGEGHCAVQ